MREELKHDIFISYRRNSGEHLAWRIVEELQRQGYDAFMDADLKAGQFDKQLYYAIDNCNDFILILSPGALDRCVNEEDWVRLEIEEAKKYNKNIIPITTKDFTFPNDLPDSLAFLKKQQTIELYSKLFDDFIAHVLTPMLVSKPKSSKMSSILLRILTVLFCVCALVFGFLYVKKLPPFLPEPLIPTEEFPPTPIQNQTVTDIQTQTEDIAEETPEQTESPKYTLTPTPEKTETVPMRDIILIAPENMSVHNFKSAIDILKGRLDIFAGSYPYEMNVAVDTVNLSLPEAAFGDHDVTGILRCYLSRAIELYIFSNLDSTNKINVPRDDIASVTLMHGAIAGVDTSEYGIQEDNYPFIRIVLSDEFVDKYHEQISEWGEQLTFGQDVSLDPWYYYSTFSEGDGKTFFLLDDYGEVFTELVVYNLTHNSFSDSFFINIPVNIAWENIEEIPSPGAYQCNLEDLTGETIQIIYKTYEGNIEEMTAGEWLDTQMVFKQRFDALEQPYCFGTTDNPYEIAVKTGTAHYSEKVLNLAGESYLRAHIKISSGLNKIGGSPGQFSIHQGDDGNWEIVLSESYKRDIEVMDTFVKMAADQRKELICLINSMPWFKTSADNMTKSGEIRFDQLCFDGFETIGPEYSWLMRYLDTIINGTKIPHFYEVNSITYNTENEIRDFMNYGEENTVLEENILQAAPDAEVIFDQDSIRVFLNLPVDSDLPQKGLAFGQKIFESVSLENCPYDSIIIYLIDEDNSTKERARIIFSKHYKNYYSQDDFSVNDDESYCYVYGAFNGGRLNDYREDFLSLIENDSFYQNMHKDTFWF